MDYGENRGVSLLSVVGSMFPKVLIGVVVETIEREIGKQQGIPEGIEMV